MNKGVLVCLVVAVAAFSVAKGLTITYSEKKCPGIGSPTACYAGSCGPSEDRISNVCNCVTGFTGVCCKTPCTGDTCSLLAKTADCLKGITDAKSGYPG